ncbi:hypothetical protein [Collimonas humicola]|uniref:hypothetical protein n=1 Tax=Collimonas humicola TaxID=2825886 RepID=UPI001B8B3BD9|nr:hypothetical protein [Collimonas humicola]
MQAALYFFKETESDAPASANSINAMAAQESPVASMRDDPLGATISTRATPLPLSMPKNGNARLG